jgi:hypothetical protein
LCAFKDPAGEDRPDAGGVRPNVGVPRREERSRRFCCEADTRKLTEMHVKHERC